VGVFLRRRPSSALPWPFADPTHQPLYFAGRNCFTPDLLRRPIPSQTRPLPLLRLIPPTKRFRPNRDASVRPRQPHAAPLHPLAVGRRLQTEPSHHVVVRRCAVVACRSTPLLHSPQCRGQAPATSFHAAPPDGSCAHASPRLLSSPPPFVV
jgi:hypothetical protein